MKDTHLFKTTERELKKFLKTVAYAAKKTKTGKAYDAIHFEVNDCKNLVLFARNSARFAVISTEIKTSIFNPFSLSSKQVKDLISKLKNPNGVVDCFKNINSCSFCLKDSEQVYPLLEKIYRPDYAHIANHAFRNPAARYTLNRKELISKLKLMENLDLRFNAVFLQLAENNILELLNKTSGEVQEKITIKNGDSSFEKYCMVSIACDLLLQACRAEKTELIDLVYANDKRLIKINDTHFMAGLKLDALEA